MNDGAIDRIRSVPLFSEFSDKDLHRVVAIAKEVSFPAGKEVSREGETGIGFHVIVDGTADVTVEGATHANLGAGAYFGEMSLLDGLPRSATVTATTDLKTVSMTSWDFNALIEQHPEISKKLLIELCRRLRAVERSSTQ